MKFVYSMDSDDYSITTTSSGGNFPVGNVQNEQLARYYKPTNNTFSITFTNNGTLIGITYLCLVGSYQYFEPTEYTITLKASATGLFSGEETNYTITPQYTYDTDSPYNVEMFPVSTISVKYFRVVFDYVSGSAGGTLSRVVLASSSLDADNIRPEPKIGIQTTNKKLISNTGQVYRTSGYSHKVHDVSSPYITNSVRSSLNTMFASVGNDTAFFADIYESTEENQSYCIFDQDILNFTRNRGGFYTVGMKLMEVF